MSHTRTYDYKTDAEEAIVGWFADRAQAQGKTSPVTVRRAFVDISPTGTVSYYIYRGIAGEKAYLAHDGTAYRDGNTVTFGEKPSYFPKPGKVKWETLAGPRAVAGKSRFGS